MAVTHGETVPWFFLVCLLLNDHGLPSQQPRLKDLKSCTIVGGTPSSEQKEHLQEGGEFWRGAAVTLMVTVEENMVRLLLQQSRHVSFNIVQHI